MPVADRTPRQVRPRASHLFLKIDQSIYGVHPVPCENAAVVKAYRLNKPDGTLYDVAQTRFGPQCDCPDFVYRRDGLDPSGCKHVQALVAQGLIEGPSAASR
jgi:hypothetical protein